MDKCKMIAVVLLSLMLIPSIVFGSKVVDNTVDNPPLGEPFNPAGLALTAGASFIARGFSGDPNGLARMLVEAIRHTGFSFVQVLSPCPTFRPEQMQWKKQVRGFEETCTDDPILAAQRIQADDGMSTGIIFSCEFVVFQPKDTAAADLESMEREFVI